MGNSDRNIICPIIISRLHYLYALFPQLWKTSFEMCAKMLILIYSRPYLPFRQYSPHQLTMLKTHLSTEQSRVPSISCAIRHSRCCCTPVRGIPGIMLCANSRGKMTKSPWFNIPLKYPGTSNTQHPIVTI